MKSIIIIIALYIGLSTYAQVGIGTTNPDPSASLDVTSTTAGILVPRMTETQRLAVASPATGLLVYQNDNTNGFWFYDGTVWSSLSGSGGNSGEFQSIGGIVQNTTNINNDNFVFGSSDLNNVAGYNDSNRMFFNKSKGAFRAGRALNGEWDDINVGLYSIGLGQDALARGNNSVAIGNIAGATGDDSIGINGGAEGFGSIAIGATSSGFRAISIGQHSLASGKNAITLGFSSNSTAEYSIATGYNTIASGKYAMSFGNYSEASGLNSFAFGEICTSQGENSYSFGYRSDAIGNGSVAIGRLAIAQGDHSFALGRFSEAYSYHEIVLGYDPWSYTPLSTTTAIGTDRLFVVANGFSGPSNALTILKNGKTGFLRIPTTNTLEVEGEASKTNPGSWVGNSDSRLKKNIETISEEEALAAILKLRGVTYEWNDNKTGAKRPEGVQYGFIAQELQEVFPEKVTEDALGYLQTAYGDYDPIVVQAIKALHTKIETLIQENADLKAQINRQVDVNQRIEALETALLEIKNNVNP